MFRRAIPDNMITGGASNADGSHRLHAHRWHIIMAGHRIFATPFAGVYPLYVAKAERKGRTREEVDALICWLTGYDQVGLQHQLEQRTSFEDFFAQAPALHPHRTRITGVVCGVRVEAVDDPLMQLIRYLDKLIDELAKGRPMDKIRRA